jgi:integrase
MTTALLTPQAATFERIKALVLDGLGSPESRRAYGKALDDFLGWCQRQDPPPAFTKAAVQRYRAELGEARGLSPATVNLRLSAVRRLAAEAADNGLMRADLAAGIGRVRGAGGQQVRLGLWLTREQAEQLLSAPNSATPKGRRDRALLAVLIGAGLRRKEAAALTIEHIQQREGRWVIVDLAGKGGRVRSVPIPSWTKAATDVWIAAAGIADGLVFRESSGSANYADAVRLLKRRQGEIVTGKFAGLGPERITFGELAQDVVNDYRDNDRASVGHVERRLHKHLLPVFGEIRAADFGTAHVKRYTENRRKDGASNATINRELAVVKRAFHLAVECDPPRVMRIPHIPMLEENNIRTGFLEYDAYLRLRDELPEEIRSLFVLGYHTGARLGELKSLCWDQVDLAANRITLNPGTTKNREGRSLPVYGEMIEWLRVEKDIRDAQSPDCPFVFRRGGKPVRNFRKAWVEACGRAGVPGLLFHDLRRAAVRNMVRAGIPEKIAMQISGHKTRSVFDRYNIVSDRDLDLAAERMQRHLQSLGTLSGTLASPEAQDQERKEHASLLQ